METERGMQLRVHVMQDERMLSEMTVHVGAGADLGARATVREEGCFRECRASSF